MLSFGKKTVKKYLKYTIWQLRVSGLYTESESFFKEHFYWQYSVFVNVLILGVFNLSQVLYVLTNFRDIEYLMSHAYLTLSFLMCSFKAYFYLKNWPKIKGLIDLLDDEEFQPKNERQSKIFESFFWKDNLIHSMYLSLTCFVAIMYPLVTLSGERNILLFPYWLPFDYDQPMVFQIAYLHQSLGLLAFMLVNVALDMITFELTSYISTECNLLSDVLSNIYVVTEDRLVKKGVLKSGLSDVERYEKIVVGAEDTLVYCVQLHWKIIKFADDTNSFMTVLIFLQFGTSLLSLCLNMYGITAVEASVTELIITCMFIGALLTELLFFCYFGHEVVVKSSEVGLALYNTPWVECSNYFKKNLLFFMLRVRKPIKIRALDFFEMAIPTFVWILRCSWSFYVVLSRTTQKVKGK